MSDAMWPPLSLAWLIEHVGGWMDALAASFPLANSWREGNHPSSRLVVLFLWGRV